MVAQKFESTFEYKLIYIYSLVVYQSEIVLTNNLIQIFLTKTLKSPFNF